MKPLDYIAMLNTLTSIYSQLPHTSGQSHSIEAYTIFKDHIDELGKLTWTLLSRL
jgi:hypothetical protein